MLFEDQSALNSPNLCRDGLHPHMPLPTYSPGATERPVRIACHRGDWRNYVENSLEAVESCIEMGADIVEVDVWRTKDGQLVLMHDPTLDRCTSGNGLVADHTLAEIQALRMKDGLGNLTEYKVPSLEEVLRLAKGRVMINLDKADLYLDEVYRILHAMDMLGQTIVKSETPFATLRKKWGSIVDHVIFMPVFNITANTTEEEVKVLFEPRHDVYEINFTDMYEMPLRLVKEYAAATGAVVWVNTIWPETSGGHSDDRAIKNKDKNWGFVVEELGAGILQTDRPQLLLSYLKERSMRPRG